MGIPAYPGCENFLVGPGLEIQAEYDKRAKTEVLRSFAFFAFEYLLEPDKKHGPLDVKFDASKYPILTFVFLGNVTNVISDPKIIQELYTTHNESLDKHEMAQDLF